MTPQKLRVFKKHTLKLIKLKIFWKIIRQDFDIYWNIDYQKAKKLKKKQKKWIRHTNKQASKQINKRTNKETKNKQTSNVACFFFGPMQWLEPLRAAKRYK